MKLWGGRFAGAGDAQADSFHSSIGFDRRFWQADIAGSIAHARMLGAQGILPAQDVQAILGGLAAIRDDIAAGRLQIDPAAEDIHTFMEQELTRRIGDAGKRLHTGRSRNDQVALDCRIYVKTACADVRAQLAALRLLLARLAREHAGTVMPGFTHMQKAQPITLGFHLMAYCEMFGRDMRRFAQCAAHADEMPLGSGALAGTTYPLDRDRVREELGFAALSANALDAVSDRDFVIEYISAASLCMMHLSRFCEELITWTSDEYRFAAMADAYATGSSIMPQKKNPDMAELIRGKTGRVYGSLMSLLTTMKGLPLAYNTDLQEDKEALFNAQDTLQACLDVFTGMLGSLRFYPERMRGSAAGGFTNATEIADYLAVRGMPFREAHELTGRMVLYCIDRGMALGELSLAQFTAFSPLFGEDIYAALDLNACVERRALPGGPAKAALLAHIEATLAQLQPWQAQP